MRLDVVLGRTTTAGTVTARATAHGHFLLSLSPNSDWGGAEWIGLKNASDTAAQFRTLTNIHRMGILKAADVDSATLFVAGLGGYRATVNGRPLDPTAIRGSVTEWGNRTFYFGDDVTADLRSTRSLRDPS